VEEHTRSAGNESHVQEGRRFGGGGEGGHLILRHLLCVGHGSQHAEAAPNQKQELQSRYISAVKVSPAPTPFTPPPPRPPPPHHATITTPPHHYGTTTSTTTTTLTCFMAVSSLSSSACPATWPSRLANWLHSTRAASAAASPVHRSTRAQHSRGQHGRGQGRGQGSTVGQWGGQGREPAGWSVMHPSMSHRCPG